MVDVEDIMKRFKHGIEGIKVVKNTYDAQPVKRALMSYADSKGPNQHVHLSSLIWAFSVCQHILQYFH